MERSSDTTGGREQKGEHSLEDLIGALRREFGTRYEESYERGKRDFRDALVKHLGLDQDRASGMIDDLEEAQAIRFKSAGSSSPREGDGPRVGLFDEPGPQVADDRQPNYGGRYWAVGTDEDVDLPGAV